MKKYLFITLIIALLIIGNIWCYIENQRLLNPMTNLVMIQYITLDNLLIWFMFSIFIFIIWGLCMGDPDTSPTANIIISVICAILALPITLIIGLIVLGIYLGIKPYNHIRKPRKKKRRS